MKVIVPCCGRSSRYPSQAPKWMLPSHDGRPMLSLAVSRLDVAPKDLVVTILREHEDRYQITKGIAAAFGQAIQTVVLAEPTKSQAETVARTLEQLKLAEPFLVKDSDNVFALGEVSQEYNYICVSSLNHFDAINPRNKSYLQVDHKGNVTNIREKVVISDLFSVGGYYFHQPAQFLSYYQRLLGKATDWNRELYISDVIGAMILDGIPFRAREVTHYEDWGTIHEWRRALLARRAYFVLVDGYLFERGSEFFRPRFDEAKPHPEAIKSVQAAAQKGHTIRYLSIRPASLAKVTQTQLDAAGLPAGDVLYGCPVGNWSLVTAPHDTLPFATSQALELGPDDPNLESKLLGER